jgi:hypothetical protein
MSKQLGTKRLKLITKSSQKVVGPMKLKCSRLISIGLAIGRRQLWAKSVKPTPNNRKLIKKVINCSVTLLKKLLLMNSSKIGRLSSRLIFLTKKRPHLISLLEGPRGRPEGGEWEPIKILLENLAYIPNPSRNPSLLALSRPPSYRLAIGPRNRARNRT